MGYTGAASAARVELPLAVPVIAAGLRVAAVSNVSIVSVASLIGVSAARRPPHRRLQPGASRPSRHRHRRVRAARAGLRRRHRAGHPAAHAVAEGRGRGHDQLHLGLVHRPGELAGADGIPNRLLQHLDLHRDGAAHRGRHRNPLGAVGRPHRARPLVVSLGQLGCGPCPPSACSSRCPCGWARRSPGTSRSSSRASSSLAVLAIPPLLAGTYAGIEARRPAARDAAKGMGMTRAQVLRQVELPVALPLLLSGIALGVPPGGRDRNRRRDHRARRARPLPHRRHRLQRLPQMTAGGAILVAVLAVGARRCVRPDPAPCGLPGLTGRRVGGRGKDSRSVAVEPDRPPADVRTPAAPA